MPTIKPSRDGMAKRRALFEIADVILRVVIARQPS
jgi:hypothetical protein